MKIRRWTLQLHVSRFNFLCLHDWGCQFPPKPHTMNFFSSFFKPLPSIVISYERLRRQNHFQHHVLLLFKDLPRFLVYLVHLDDRPCKFKTKPHLVISARAHDSQKDDAEQTAWVLWWMRRFLDLAQEKPGAKAAAVGSKSRSRTGS